MTDAAPTPTLNSWLHPLAGGEPPPLSDRLMRALEAHAAASAADVATCRELANRMADPVVHLLVGMIVDDEQRHDSLLRSMIRRLEEEVDFVPMQGALPVPNGSMPNDPQAAAEIAAPVYPAADTPVTAPTMPKTVPAQPSAAPLLFSLASATSLNSVTVPLITNGPSSPTPRRPDGFPLCSR